MEVPQKIIKIIPYKGINNEIFEGKKTKISLFEDRLEYIIKFTQKVKIEKIGESDQIPEEVLSYTDEEGFLLKNSIVAITKYIETEYKGEDKDTIEAFTVNYVDISSGTCNLLTFSLESEEAKDELYTNLKDWLLNDR